MSPDVSILVRLLGTGTSTGVPVLGCTCAVCTSTDPRNKRLRAACWIEVAGIGLLVDSGPDLRQQAIAAGIDRVDAVLYTHHHYDHISGIDDLRPFCFGVPTPIPCYANAGTVRTLENMFKYIFSDERYPSAPRLRLEEVSTTFTVSSRYADSSASPVTVTPLPVFHGSLPILGFRVGDFAYITDTNRIPDATVSLLAGVDTLVLDGLRHEPHPTHFTVAEAIDVARRIGARKTYFTHLTHTMDHAVEDAALPDGIHLAYDGLVLEVPVSTSVP